MLRVLHIVGTMNRGGTETLLMELYRHIDRTKIQFDFLTYNYSEQKGIYDDEILRLGGKIYKAKGKFYKNPFAYCIELKNFFREHPEYQIIHAHQYKMSGYMLAMAKRSGKRITISHSHVANSKPDFLRRVANVIGEKLIKKHADFCFGCSESALYSLIGEKSDNIKKFVLKNAVDAEKFRYSVQKRAEWREKLGSNAQTMVLGNVARFYYPKNHKFLIETFIEILKIRPNSLLVLIGDGHLLSDMKQFVKEQQIEEKVCFLGSRGDVQDIINAFDVFVMPSRYEGLGIVLIEAQANGLPCVISADVIPEEADLKAGLVRRVSLEQDAVVWAKECINISKRIDSKLARKAIKEAGYDIQAVANWLQEFYISQTDGE